MKAKPSVVFGDYVVVSITHVNHMHKSMRVYRDSVFLGVVIGRRQKPSHKTMRYTFMVAGGQHESSVTLKTWQDAVLQLGTVAIRNRRTERRIKEVRASVSPKVHAHRSAFAAALSKQINRSFR